MVKYDRTGVIEIAQLFVVRRSQNKHSPSDSPRVISVLTWKANVNSLCYLFFGFLDSEKLPKY